MSSSSDITIERVASVDLFSLDGLSTRCCGLTSRGRLKQLERDSRWESAYVVSRLGGRVVGVVPCASLRIRKWPDPAYDVGLLLGGDGSTGLDWMLVGGRADRAAGFLCDRTLPADVLSKVAVLSGHEVRALSREQGRRIASVYASEQESKLLRTVIGESVSSTLLTHESRIEVQGDGVADYLASLSPSHREIVRRDWRQRDASGVRSRAVEWT